MGTRAGKTTVLGEDQITSGGADEDWSHRRQAIARGGRCHFDLKLSAHGVNEVAQGRIGFVAYLTGNHRIVGHRGVAHVVEDDGIVARRHFQRDPAEVAFTVNVHLQAQKLQSGPAERSASAHVGAQDRISRSVGTGHDFPAVEGVGVAPRGGVHHIRIPE